MQSRTLTPDLKHLSAALALTVTVLTASAHASTFSEDFDAMADGTAIDTVADWSMANSGAAWNVLDAAGYSGAGLEVSTQNGALRELTGAEIYTVGAANNTFEAKIRATGTENRYSNPWVLLFGNDGSGEAGFGIRFSGGGTLDAGNPIGSIQLTDGTGSAWWNAGLSTIQDGGGNVQWLANTWYTVQFQNIDSDGATLRIVETDSGDVLIDGVDISAYGPTITQIDHVILRESGIARTTRYDDLQFIPEPASLAVVGLGALVMVRRRHA